VRYLTHLFSPRPKLFFFAPRFARRGGAAVPAVLRACGAPAARGANTADYNAGLLAPARAWEPPRVPRLTGGRRFSDEKCNPCMYLLTVP
jgi:CelD/BcsL family acetyltransferase involved in cellulose biosynthesis